MLDENLEKFLCWRKTVKWPLLFFYSMVDAVANNAYILIKKCGRYSKSKKCFLKNLSFQIAKSAVEDRLRLSKQKYNVKDATAQVGFSTPTESNVTPRPTVSSHQARCRICKKQTRSRCRPGARIAWHGGINKFGEGHKKFAALNLREWTKKQRPLLQIFTNFGVKTKEKKKKERKRKVFISKNTQISTISKVKPQQKGVFNAKSGKKQFLLTNSWMTTSILGVSAFELHSSGTVPDTFFGAQSSLWGHNSCLGYTSSDLGGTTPKCP